MSNCTHSIKCHIPFQNMVIDANGNVSACPYIISDPDRPWSMGNVNESSILEVWNSPAYQQLRAFMLSPEGAQGCKGCLNMLQNGGSVAAMPQFTDVEQYETMPAWQNYQQFLDDIANKRTIMQAKPMVVSYTSSHSCNFRCIMCYQQHVREDKLLHMEKTDTEMMELVPYLAQLTAGGGEPFIQPMWKRIIYKYSGEYPLLTFAVTTNGSFVDEKAIAALSCFSRVLMNFSYDGTSKEIFEKIRIRSDFNAVHKNLLANIDYMHQVGIQKYYTTASMTVMKENFEDVIPMLQFMLEKHVQVNFSGLVIYPLSNSLISYENLPIEMPPMLQTADSIASYLEAPIFNSAFACSAKAQIHSFLDVLPRRLLKCKHYRLEGRIPPLYFISIKAAYGTKGLQIAFAQDEQGAIGKPYWYASVDEAGYFTAVLPEGKYAVHVRPGNIGAVPTHMYLTVFVSSANMEIQLNVGDSSRLTKRQLLQHGWNCIKRFCRKKKRL